MSKKIFCQKKWMLATIPAMILGSSTSFAAIPVDLNHQTGAILSAFTTNNYHKKSNDLNLQETRRAIDFNQTLHVRLQETYQGYPVIGGDITVHVPKGGKVEKNIMALSRAITNAKGSMNGTLYQGIDKDLANIRHPALSVSQEQTALKTAIQLYKQKVGTAISVEDETTQLVVFMDQKNKAHWAYQVGFTVLPNASSKIPAKPRYYLDATTQQVYAEWDDIKTSEKVDIKAGGFGGNKKMGKLVYDGLGTNLPSLEMNRDDESATCYLQNKDVTVMRYFNNEILSFPCANTDPDHNNIYWNADFDTVNGGFSPGNDALFGGLVIQKMYKEWYGIPALTNPDGTPMILKMVVHVPFYDNAYWDGKKMTFGDGFLMFYPLTSLGVAAHEISHGFTEQHSNLAYYGQHGGMNEAFSDMAAQGAEFFAYGKNSWQIGPEIFKAENEALRYMDQPSKDCNGKQPGKRCSIDDASQYYNGLDVHYSSGVYNRVFYLIGTAEGWDTKKAFNVMVQANRYYWTATSSFDQGACGVIKAAEDYGYDKDGVVNAFKTVKVDISKC